MNKHQNINVIETDGFFFSQCNREHFPCAAAAGRDMRIFPSTAMWNVLDDNARLCLPNKSSQRISDNILICPHFDGAVARCQDAPHPHMVRKIRTFSAYKFVKGHIKVEHSFCMGFVTNVESFFLFVFINIELTIERNYRGMRDVPSSCFRLHRKIPSQHKCVVRRAMKIRFSLIPYACACIYYNLSAIVSMRILRFFQSTKLE